MQNTKKIYVVGNQLAYANFIKNHKLVNNIEDADIVIFTGGEDVDPSLYGCECHQTTRANISRDKAEIAEFEKIRPDQLCIGICRGSQFLCVMNGGKLIQNVNHHAICDTHSILENNSSRVYEITSTHHQMQYPFDIPTEEWTCLFTSVSPLSTIYQGDNIDLMRILFEPEIILYHKKNFPRCLAIQGHPEYMRAESPIVIRLNKIINDLLKDEN